MYMPYDPAPRHASKIRYISTVSGLFKNGAFGGRAQTDVPGASLCVWMMVGGTAVECAVVVEVAMIIRPLFEVVHTWFGAEFFA